MDKTLKCKRRKGMVRGFLPFSLFTFLLLLTSCGELFEVNEEDAPLGQVFMERRQVDLMVGDSYKLPVSLNLAENIDATLHFQSPDNAIVQLRGDTVDAVAPGIIFVSVEAAGGALRDSCLVTVHPRWQVDPTQFQCDMVVFAQVTVNGQPFGEGMMVGAFNESTEELCGVGTILTHDGQDYMLLRIFSHDNSHENIVLRCYDRSRALIVQAEEPIAFSADDTMGTLSGLYPLVFD